VKEKDMAKKLTKKIRGVRPKRGSVRWHQDEWRRAFGGELPEAAVAALAELSYQDERLRSRIETLEGEIERLDGLIEVAARRANGAVGVLDDLTRKLARGPELPWAQRVRLDGRPN
jgi:hypothetical protein